MEKLIEFHKIIDDLENTEVKIDDEDKTLLMFRSLLKSFEPFNVTFLYVKKVTITSNEV